MLFFGTCYHKTVKAISYVSLCLLFILTGCVQQENQQPINNDNYKKNTQNDEFVDVFKEKNEAIDLYFESEGEKFSAEVVDNYKGKNIYASIFCIDDVFYLNNDLFMYAENWKDEKFLLKISPEQYSNIKNLNNDSSVFDMHIIYNLENIEPMFPSLNGSFSFDIYAPGDLSTDTDEFISFNSRIIRGTLVDIIELKN